MSEYDFIEYIKRKRLSLFISQKDLAKQIPIASSAYCKIENHQQTLSIFILGRLAEILDIDLNILRLPSNPKHVFFD